MGRAGSSPNVESASTPPIDRPSETTPLLNGENTSEPALQPRPASSPGGSGDDDDDDEEQTILVTDISTTRVNIILTTVYVGTFLGAVDASIIATLSAAISSEFHSLSLLSWLATSYLIANAACQPLSGRLTDIFGRGPGLVFSNLFFALGNLGNIDEFL